MRVCFVLQVRPELVDEYVERHRAVWPEMLQAIHDAGRRHYSLFLRDDGMLVGSYETDDDAVSPPTPVPPPGRSGPRASSSPSRGTAPTRASHSCGRCSTSGSSSGPTAWILQEGEISD